MGWSNNKDTFIGENRSSPNQDLNGTILVLLFGSIFAIGITQFMILSFKAAPLFAIPILAVWFIIMCMLFYLPIAKIFGLDNAEIPKVKEKRSEENKPTISNEETIEKIESEWNHPIPQDIYRRWVIYMHSKDKLIKRRAILASILKNDIESRWVYNSQIDEIYLSLWELSRDIIRTTDLLIDILPEDIHVMSEFDDRSIFYNYLDYLLHEMSSLEEMSKDIQHDIQTWMVYHHIEVSQEKEKLEKVLREGTDKISQGMSTLLATSEALRASWDESQITDILVQQRI